MSNEAITWAYRQACSSSGAKFVLVALADMADDRHSCFPGQAKLAEMTGQSERSVRRQLLELEVAGLVARSRRFQSDGHRTSDRYVLPVTTGQSDQRSNEPPANPASGQNGQRSTVRRPPATTGETTGQDVRVSLREPSLEPPVEDLSSDAPRPDVERICKHLADRIEANGSKRPRIDKRWRTAARLMLDRDERDEAKVHLAIDWCQADEFWRSNILSMPKLREKYDQLRLAAKRTAPAVGGSVADQRVAIGRDLTERLRRQERGEISA